MVPHCRRSDDGFDIRVGDGKNVPTASVDGDDTTTIGNRGRGKLAEINDIGTATSIDRIGIAGLSSGETKDVASGSSDHLIIPTATDDRVLPNRTAAVEIIIPNPTEEYVIIAAA